MAITKNGQINSFSPVETEKSNESCLCLQISPVMTFLGLVMDMNQSLLKHESIFESCHEHARVINIFSLPLVSI